MTDPIARAAEKAVDRHDALLHSKVLELLLGAMVSRQGVYEVRRLLLWYARGLKWF